MDTPAEFESGTRQISGLTAEIVSTAAPSRGRTVGVVTILTLLVAALGYFREAILAARFGVSSTMDAYFGAIFIPTNIYLILVVGTVSPILIPILLKDGQFLLRAHSDTRDQATDSFNVVTSFVSLFFSAIVVLGVFTARFWLSWLFPGFDATTRAMALRLIYIVFPSVLMLGLAGMLTATLNGYRRFAVAAFSPALSSLAVIITALSVRGPLAIYAVAAATTIGFLLQFLILVPAAKSLGVRFRPVVRLRHPAIRKLLQLGTPLMLYLLVANASLVVERNLASRLSTGALSALTYAMRIFTVPSNLLAAPLAIVAYPHFAREVLRENYGELRRELDHTLRLVIFLFLPVSVWLIQNALPVTRLLYEHGQFTPANSWLVSRVLILYSIGILPNVLAIIFLRCFYALEDTVTPLWAELIDLAFFVTCATWLSHRFGILGLAFTRGMTFFVVGGILATVLWQKKILLKVDREALVFIVQSASATVVMSLVNWIGLKALTTFLHPGTTRGLLIEIGILLVLSGATFLGVASLFKMQETEKLFRTASGLFRAP
jgi:putative peptidoglycan lipid II flippase